MMYGCQKCTSVCGWLFLIVGVLFLLRDFGMWTFWNINWWTIVFLLWGLGGIAMSNCKACQTMREGKKR